MNNGRNEIEPTSKGLESWVVVGEDGKKKPVFEPEIKPKEVNPQPEGINRRTLFKLGAAAVVAAATGYEVARSTINDDPEEVPVNVIEISPEPALVIQPEDLQFQVAREVVFQLAPPPAVEKLEVGPIKNQDLRHLLESPYNGQLYQEGTFNLSELNQQTVQKMRQRVPGQALALADFYLGEMLKVDFTVATRMASLSAELNPEAVGEVRRNWQQARQNFIKEESIAEDKLAQERVVTPENYLTHEQAIVQLSEALPEINQRQSSQLAAAWRSPFLVWSPELLAEYLKFQFDQIKEFDQISTSYPNDYEMVASAPLGEALHRALTEGVAQDEKVQNIVAGLEALPYVGPSIEEAFEKLNRMSKLLPEVDLPLHLTIFKSQNGKWAWSLDLGGLDVGDRVKIKTLGQVAVELFGRKNR